MITRKEYLKLNERYDNGSHWIARDKDGQLYIYDREPLKMEDGWKNSELNSFYTYEDDRLFQFIKWEDEEPTRIDDLIRDYESHQVITGGNNVNKSELIKEIEDILDDIGVSDYQLGECDEDTIWAISSITIREILSAIEKCSVEKEKLYTVDLNFNQALGKRNGAIKFYDPNDKLWVVERKLTKAEIESVNPILMKIAKEVE